MKVFWFIDTITERKPGESITASFKLKGDEEFLQDHFAGFPVMPGVLLLEALKQASVALLVEPGSARVLYRLVGAEEVKFGQFVRPGNELKITARLVKTEGFVHFFEGRIDLIDPSQKGNGRKALAASLALEPVKD